MNHVETNDGNHEGFRVLGSEFGYSRGESSVMSVARFDSEKDSVRPSDPFDPSKSYGQTRSEFEADFEQRYVSWLLARHSGNISAAAREARMDRKHLHDLAKKHGLRGRDAAARR
jgi:DNA-binding NtrC family response regulator